MPEPRVVVGGTPAALTAVDALGMAGVPVRWLAPERGIGRGFAPMPRDGRTLQLGVRLLELGYEDDGVPPPLAAYRPGTSGHRPFTPLIREWVQRLVGERLREIAPPRVVLDGALHDDYLFTVDLAGVPDALPARERATIAAQAAAAAAALGDAGLLADGGARLNGHSLAEASRANHGDAFHARLIEPLAGKFVPGGAEAILADWRRKAWLPLFWPRTVHEAFAGERTPGFRPRRSFHELTPGGIGGLIEALEQRIATHASVERIAVGGLAGVERRGDMLRLCFDGGHVEDAARPALGVPAAELQAALGIDAGVERVRTAIAWIELDADALPEGLELVHVLDPDNPIARVSGGSTTPAPGRRVLCVELRHDQPDGTLAQAALAGLRNAGLLLKGGDPVSIHEGAMATLPLPTAATRARLTAAHAALTARALDAELLGGALEPGADSLNEQIVQGLRAAEALSA